MADYPSYEDQGQEELIEEPRTQGRSMNFMRTLFELLREDGIFGGLHPEEYIRWDRTGRIIEVIDVCTLLLGA